MPRYRDFFKDEYNYVIVYTDGACSYNGYKGAAAGIGVWFYDNCELNLSEPLIGKPTNNRAEIHAAKRAIEQAAHYGFDALVIKTDSKYLKYAMTRWIFGWKKYKWWKRNGGRVKNRHDFQALDSVIWKTGMNVWWSYVPAHSGIYGNDQADRLARDGVKMYRRNNFY